MKISKIFFSFLALFCMSFSAQSAPVIFIAGGLLDIVDSSLTGTFLVGDTFEIILTYDDQMIDSLPGNPTFGLYRDPVISFSGSIAGSYNFSWMMSDNVSNQSEINTNLNVFVFK